MAKVKLRFFPEQLAGHGVNFRDDLPWLIAGQGLAGTAVAWRLWERGIPFMVVDPKEEESCSRVAAGLVTPVTGMRLNPGWRVDACIPEALEFYRKIEGLVGTAFYVEKPHVRFFKDAREAGLWQKRREDPRVRRWVEREVASGEPSFAPFHTEWGGVVMRGSAWLDTVAYLAASRAFFAKCGAFQLGMVKESEVTFHEREIGWRAARYAGLIFCRGWQEAAGGLFPGLPFASAKGVIVDVATEAPRGAITNRGGWLLPCGETGWRGGSTYEFDFARPLEESVAEVESKLRQLLRDPFVMGRARSGIRPILKRLPAVMGRHPTHGSTVALLNGLGSKGAMKSPLLARWLVAHLHDGASFEEGVDVRGNL